MNDKLEIMIRLVESWASPRMMSDEDIRGVSIFADKMIEEATADEEPKQESTLDEGVEEVIKGIEEYLPLNDFNNEMDIIRQTIAYLEAENKRLKDTWVSDDFLLQALDAFAELCLGEGDLYWNLHEHTARLLAKRKESKS